MSDFLAPQDRDLLTRHGLSTFDALWHLSLEAVDEPNTGRGGWSSVYRLELEGRGFYLKRQSGYLTRTLHAPLGEPTLAREFRNISRYQRLAVPTLEAVFFGQRRVDGQDQAILMTRALDGWTDLETLLAQWATLPGAQRQAVLRSCGQLVHTLHDAGQLHGCLYPKHIFMRGEGDFYAARLIDLEKTRPLLFGQRDRVRDLEPLLRRARVLGADDVRTLLTAYLDVPAESPAIEQWLRRLGQRRLHKEAR